MSSLVLEGGTFRPIFSAGIMDALLDNDIMFPYCIGVSAGITNGISYISKQKGRNLEILQKYRNDKRYLSFRNYFKCRSMFGLDFVFGELPNTLCVFDHDTYNSYKGKVIVGVTNAETGKPEYLDGSKLDDKCTMLRATCAIPLVFPPIKINNKFYFDGGISDPVPIKKAIEDGNEKHLIILTQPKGYQKEFSRKNEFVAKVYNKRFPGLREPLMNRHIKYNETIKFCEQLEKEGKALILRPSESINSFEKDVNLIKKYYDEGYNMAVNNLDKIKAIYNEE